MRRYTIILEPDEAEGGYTVTVPALPGCITQGESVEQCIERAKEAILGYIESLHASGLNPPESCCTIGCSRLPRSHRGRN